MVLDTLERPPATQAPVKQEEEQEQLELPGVFLSREYAELAWDEDRDEYTQKQRGAAWDNLYAQHALRKHLKRPYDHCNYLISGDKGIGKSAVAAMLSMLNYAQGMEVFSTASFLFGQRIDAMDVFTMAESLPTNCVVFVDEAHSVADRYSENASRNRTLASSIALLRKNGVRLIFASVHEHAVAMTIKSEIDTLVYPTIYTPANPKYPSYCYVYLNLIGPQPFRGRREADNWGIQRFGGDVRLQRKVMPPHLIYEACKVMDTWAKADIAAGLMTTAADIRERLEKNDDKPLFDKELEQKFLADLIPAIRGGWRPETRVPWDTVASQVQQYGSEFDDATVRKLCKRLFAMDGQGMIKPQNIFDKFNIQKGAA